MDLSGFRETISTRGKILPALSRMVGSVNGKSIIVPRIRVLGQGRSLAHPTIKQDQPSAADMLDGLHKPQPFFEKLLVSRETGHLVVWRFQFYGNRVNQDLARFCATGTKYYAPVS